MKEVDKKTLPFLPGTELVGYGFNIFGNIDASSKTELVLDKGELTTYCYKDCEFSSYKNLDVSSIEEIDSSIQTLSSRHELEKSLDTQVGISIKTNSFLAGSFNAEIDARYGSIVNTEEENYYVLSQTNSKLWSVSAKNTKLLDKEDLKNLPEKFDPDNPAQFFNVLEKYGAFYIKEVYVGASFHYYEAISQSHVKDKKTAELNAQLEYKSLFTDTKAEAESDWSEITENWKKYRQSYAQVKGGDHTGLSNIINPDNVNFHDAFELWLKSVNQGSGVPINFTLAPIYDLFSKDQKRQAMKDATHAYLDNRFYIEANGKSPYIIANGTSLQPQNSFPTIENESNPSVWVVVLDRFTREIKLNMLFPLMTPCYSNTFNPKELDQKDYQERIYLALAPYQSKDHLATSIILLASYDLSLPSMEKILVHEPQEQGFIGFLKNSGAGEGLDQWMQSFMHSMGTYSNYILTGVCGGGPNQGMDLFKSPAIYSGAFIPSTVQSRVLFNPVVTSTGKDSAEINMKLNNEANHCIHPTLGNTEDDSFTIELKSSSQDNSTIMFNGKEINPQNGFPIVPSGRVYRGYWIIIVDKETGKLIFNVFFDDSDLDRIEKALTSFNKEGRYILGIVYCVKNHLDLNISPHNTKFGKFLLDSGASENALNQWYIDTTSHSSSAFSGCCYAMIGSIGSGPEQGKEVYKPVISLPDQPDSAVVKASFKVAADMVVFA